MDTQIEKSMKTRHFLGDALTSVSTNIIVNIAAMITYFYTDVLGIAVGAVGVILLASKLLDAFVDIAMGVIVDRTKSRYGKARPWLMRASLPVFIGIAMVFLVPAGAGNAVKIAYAAVTNVLLTAFIYTAVEVPAGSLLALETRNPRERSKMGIWRLVFAYAAGMSVSALIVPAANRMGGGQDAWIALGFIYATVSAASLVAAFFAVRERNDAPSRPERSISVLRGIRLLLRNKYWLIALAINLLIQVIYAVGAAETYYAKYILGDENLVAVIALYRLAGAAAGFALCGALVNRLGKRSLVMTGAAVAAIACAMRAVAPDSLNVNLLAIGASTLGGIPILAVSGAIVADTVEYGEWITGERTVGLASSANSFVGKLGAALYAGAAGWLLDYSGYDGMLAAQPVMAQGMIRTLNIHVPLICYGIIFALMIFYRLDREYGGIIAGLQTRGRQ